MLGSEELPRHLGAHLGPICRGDWLVSQLPGGLPGGNPLRHLDLEGAGIAGVDLEWQRPAGSLP